MFWCAFGFARKVEIKIPEYLIEEIRFALLLKPLYRSVEDFIIAAVKKLLKEKASEKKRKVLG